MTETLKNEVKSAVKQALRMETTDTTFDTELDMLIDSAIEYLRAGGVQDLIVDELRDKRVKHLIVIYCRTLFENEDDKGLPMSFDLILNQLVLDTSEDEIA